MKESGEYRLLYQNLGLGEHISSYQLEDAFFAQFDGEMILTGKIDLVVRLTKSHTTGTLELEHSGHIETTCDRCLDKIELPIEGVAQLLVREAEDAFDDEEDVLLVDSETGTLDLKEAIYDYVALSVPMIKYCDQETPCNSAVLERLRPEQDEKINPAWDELRNLEF